MSIKGLFNQKQNNENLLEKITELEKKQKRLNTLEVHIKRLLKLEEQITPLLKGGISEKKDKPPPIKTNPKDKQKVRGEAAATETDIFKKITPFLKAVDKMDKQIKELEQTVILIHQSQTELTRRLDEIEDQISRFQKEENKYELTSRLDAIEEQISMFKEEEKKSNENKPQEQTMVIKEIHIDKFYLDKYEQNNTFGQLGIKSLSGALNIGATYGREVLPKELSDQIKEDMKEFKGMKKEFENGEEESSSKTEEESSSSAEATYENETFTEIPIEVINDDD